MINTDCPRCGVNAKMQGPYVTCQNDECLLDATLFQLEAWQWLHELADSLRKSPPGWGKSPKSPDISEPELETLIDAADPDYRLDARINALLTGGGMSISKAYGFAVESIRMQDEKA